MHESIIKMKNELPKMIVSDEGKIYDGLQAFRCNDYYGVLYSDLKSKGIYITPFASFDYNNKPIHDETGEMIDMIISLKTIDAAIKHANVDNEPSKIKPKKTYIMKDGNTGLYKIGKTNNIAIRENTLASQMPMISVLAVCELDIEKQLHKKFKEKKIRGEWFSLNEDDINLLISQYNFKTY